jgi:hypothetical protein
MDYAGISVRGKVQNRPLRKSKARRDAPKVIPRSRPPAVESALLPAVDDEEKPPESRACGGPVGGDVAAGCFTQ